MLLLGGGSGGGTGSEVKQEKQLQALVEAETPQAHPPLRNQSIGTVSSLPPYLPPYPHTTPIPPYHPIPPTPYPPITCVSGHPLLCMRGENLFLSFQVLHQFSHVHHTYRCWHVRVGADGQEGGAGGGDSAQQEGGAGGGDSAQQEGGGGDSAQQGVKWVSRQDLDESAVPASVKKVSSWRILRQMLLYVFLLQYRSSDY